MLEYKTLVKQVLNTGSVKPGRNGNTIMVPGTQLKFEAKTIPLLNGRKIFYKGVFGEFSAFMNNCTTLQEFKDRGCNYWDAWANDTGTLCLDYVNQLHAKQVIGKDGNYISQLEALKIGLVNDKFSRRHIINLWVPHNLSTLSLPCCHYSYQFIVDKYNNLHMIWNQRSADVMVGVPSDILLAWLWVQCLCQELSFEPGTITMNFGDTHIYEEHISGAKEYLENIIPRLIPVAILNEKFTSLENFKPDQVDVIQYDPHSAIKFELKV